MPSVRQSKATPAKSKETETTPKSSRKPKTEVLKAARQPTRAPKKTAPSTPHTVVAEVAPTPAPESLQQALKTGDRILFTTGAETHPEAIWFKCAEAVCQQADGTALSVHWLCLTPEALRAANNEPLRAKYALLAEHHPAD